MNSGIEELKKMFFHDISNNRHFLEIFQFLKQFAKICSVPTAVMSVVSPFVQMCHNRYSHHQSPPPKPHSMILLLIISTNYELQNISPLGFLSQHLSSVVMKRKCETIMFTASCFPVVEFITTLIPGIV